MNQSVVNGAATPHQSQQQSHLYRQQQSVESGQSQAPSAPPSAGLEHHPPPRHPQQPPPPLGPGQANYSERLPDMPSNNNTVLTFPLGTTIQLNHSGMGGGGGGGGGNAGNGGGSFAQHQASQGQQFPVNAFNAPPNMFTQHQPFLAPGATPPYPPQQPFYPDINAQPPAVARPIGPPMQAGPGVYPAQPPTQSRSYPAGTYNQPGQHQSVIVSGQQQAGVGLPPPTLHQSQPAVHFPPNQQPQQPVPIQPRKRHVLAIVHPETHNAINEQELQKAAKEKDAGNSAVAGTTSASSSHAEGAQGRGTTEIAEHKREKASPNPLNDEEKKAVDIRQEFAHKIAVVALGPDGKNNALASKKDVEPDEEVPFARTAPPPSSVPPSAADGSSMAQGIDVQQRQTCSVPPPERTVTPSSVPHQPSAVADDESLAAALNEKLALHPQVPPVTHPQQSQFAPPGVPNAYTMQPPPSLIPTSTGHPPIGHPGNGSVHVPLMGGGAPQQPPPAITGSRPPFQPPYVQQPPRGSMQFGAQPRPPPLGSNLGPAAPLDEINEPDMSEELENGIDSGNLLTKEEKIRRLDEEFTGIMQDPNEKSNIDNQVYSVNFLLLMRKIVKELEHVKCPKSEAELAEIGIDLAGMPASAVPNPSRAGVPRRFEPGKDTFVPPWQPTQQQTRLTGAGGGSMRPGYGGRHSDSTKGIRSKKGPTNQRSMQFNSPAMQRNEVLPKKSETAWKPKREEKLSDRVIDDARYEDIKRELRGLLNKITPSTYEDLSTRFCEYKVHQDPKLLTRVIDLIFDKAVEEERFCPLYSDLCKKQVDLENQQAAASTAAGDQKKGGSFRLAIIDRCQKTFEGNKSEEMQELQNELEKADEDDAKKLQERVDLLKKKEKRRFLGIITFIAQLYRHDLLIDKIIEWCVVELVKRYSEQNINDEIYIEYAVKMLETVGQFYEKRKRKMPPPDSSLALPESTGGDRKKAPVTARKSQQKGGASPANAPSPAPEQQQDPIDKVLQHLASIKSKLSNRCRFMIMDLEDMRRNNWQSKNKNQGPKTMEQVRNDLEQEAAENQAEREAYDKKAAAARAEYSGRKSSRQNVNLYQGRGSTDNRSQMQQNPPFDRRAAAAQASTQATSFTQKKESVSSLKTTDQSAKLGKGGSSFFSSRKSEYSLGGGAGGGGTMYADRAAPSPPSVIASAPTPPPTQTHSSSSLMETVEEGRDPKPPSSARTATQPATEEGAARE